MSNAMKVFATVCHVVTRHARKNEWNGNDEDVVVFKNNMSMSMILITPDDAEKKALDNERYPKPRVLVPHELLIEFLEHGRIKPNRDFSIVMEKGVVKISVWATPKIEIVRTCTLEDLKVARQDRRIIDRTMETDTMLCEDRDGSFEQDLLLLIKRHRDRRAVRAEAAQAGQNPETTGSTAETAAPAPKPATTSKPASPAAKAPGDKPKPTHKPAPAPKPPVTKLGGATLGDQIAKLGLKVEGNRLVTKDEVKTPAKVVVPTAPAVPAPAPTTDDVDTVVTKTEKLVEGVDAMIARQEAESPSLDELVNATLGQTGPDPLFGDLPGTQSVAATPAPTPVEPAPAESTPEPETPVATAPSATPATAASPNTGGSKKPKAKKGPKGGKGKPVSDTEAELNAAARAGR